MSTAPAVRIAMLLLPLAAGCARPQPPADGGLPLGPDALGSASYILSATGRTDTVTLARGRYRSPDGKLEVVLLPVMAWGNLTGDDRREVAAVLVSRPAGGGTFYEVAVLADSPQGPVQVAHQPLGDRVDIEGLDVTGGVVEIHLRTHGPDDPPCCPTRRETLRFHLEGRRAS